ncbi:deoxyribonuclease IV [Candidatus Woesearchaeota archaeon]|nr:deoxyribonuclease IV [Candidatus Woesearchaeota archaeon]
MVFYIGAHASIARGFEVAVDSILAIGGNAIQVFLKSPRGRASKVLDEKDAAATRRLVKEKNLFLVGHCSYLLNFATNPNIDPWAIESLTEDLNNMHELGGAGVVLHIGKSLKMQKEETLRNIKTSIESVLHNTAEDQLIILENTAGQGTEIGYLFEEIAEIYDMFTKEQKRRLGFCLDTCHSFAAGYDLRTADGVEDWKQRFDQLIGWDRVICIHFNDAKRELGSRVDRHEDIGRGWIGKKGCAAIARLALMTEKPLILETPSTYSDYADQLKTLKTWAYSEK